MQSETRDLRRHMDGGLYQAIGWARFWVSGEENLDAETKAPVGAQILGVAKHSEDQSEITVFKAADGSLRYCFRQPSALPSRGALMIYQHLWPFEQSLWGRPAAQFAERFAPISSERAAEAMAGDRQAAQATISQTRSRRRHQEKSREQDAFRR